MTKWQIQACTCARVKLLKQIHHHQFIIISAMPMQCSNRLVYTEVVDTNTRNLCVFMVVMSENRLMVYQL